MQKVMEITFAADTGDIAHKTLCICPTKAVIISSFAFNCLMTNHWQSSILLENKTLF